MEVLNRINSVISVVFLICYAYQFAYILVPFLMRRRAHKAETPHRFAVLIAARNEEQVIGNLIASIRAQTYDPSLLRIFVAADNCTDRTAEAARRAGAVTFERHDTQRVGKGYALQFLLQKLEELEPQEQFDAYLVFDADNILDPNFITEINKTFSDGYPIVTSYRNSKNYGDSWVSAGSALWYLRETRYLNDARMRLGVSCGISGTGFLFSREILEACGGWSFFLLTEDLEFTVHNICAGRKIGFCETAMLYDEQPVSFGQSFRQRMRWTRGFLQVFGKYGGSLLRGILHGSFSCYDMAMSMMPAAVISAVGSICNLAALIWSFFRAGQLGPVLLSILTLLANTYLTVFFAGAVTLLSEWRRIETTTLRKLVSAFTFPIFMISYIPIAFCALFAKNVSWKAIAHRRVMTLEEIRGASGQTGNQPKGRKGKNDADEKETSAQENETEDGRVCAHSGAAGAAGAGGAALRAGERDGRRE